MAWAVEQRLPATKKIVLLMLANRSNSDTGKCVPKIKTLAEDCGLSESACKASLKDLADLGFITVIPRFYEGQQLPNQYQLNIAPLGRQKTPLGQEVTPVGRQVTTEPVKEPIKEPTPRASLADDGGEHFKTFWSAYPKKAGKDAAKKAFAKRKFDEQAFAKVMAALNEQKASEQWQKDGGQFIPHPATWLNQGRFEDEIGSGAAPAPGGIGNFV